ncbi:SGNH/GDSL hydrolase family protein [Agromyces salentinus]|uniref:SGNH hydrolase-type esterase domain-containing protein n=1 Tax=Agromyces salentinus TaxID=269421 RepID=A0ABP4YS90_9MICO|nr:SGNH/GDSL hydrolase family protein [Agromyces salentinus]
MGLRGASTLGLAAVAAVCAVLAGCSVPGAAEQPRPSETSAAEPAVPDASGGLTFAAVGDSITDADSPDFMAGDLGAASWATYVRDAGFGFAGGWAEWGATTARMLDEVAAYEADVLVVLAGTNDVAFGVPFAETTSNLERIVDTAGITEVVVVSIPPIDADPDGADAFNDRLEAVARDRGWRFVDGSAGLRTGDGTFREGMSSDGLHPSEAGAKVLGEAIAEELGEE